MQMRNPRMRDYSSRIDEEEDVMRMDKIEK